MVELKHGSRGAAVEAWQRALQDAVSSTLAIDGSFGVVTDAITRLYQDHRGLVVDGVVGPKTRSAMAVEVYGPESLAAALGVVAQVTSATVMAYIAPCSSAMLWAKVTSRRRLAAIVAQMGHESTGFTAWREKWGPTAAQQRYEPPSAKARELGNTVSGDGYRFRGRGPMQLTGRGNYRAAGRELTLDLEGSPDQVALPEVGFRTAAWFWRLRGLNAYADRDDFKMVTKRINGGMTGFAKRVVLWERAQRALGIA